jgi:hypothetical protein
MSFTKLHYQQFADMLGEIQDEATRELITAKCESIFKADNHRFSTDIFREWIQRRVEGKTVKGLRPNPKYTSY